jgi:hypothetical protein
MIDTAEIPETTDLPDESWVMPPWMRRYEHLIAGHGGNGVTDLMNRIRTQPNLAFSNVIVFTMCCEISAQVGLLHRFREAKLIPGHAFDEGDVVRVNDDVDVMEMPGHTGIVRVVYAAESSYTVSFGHLGHWTYREDELTLVEMRKETRE